MRTHLPFITVLVIAACLGANSFAQTLPHPDHIVILFEENYAYGEIIGSSSAPNINALAADTNAAVFTNFYAIEHPSQPNYIDLFSGGDQGVTDDNVPTDYPFTTPNLCAELLAAGKTFTTYEEELPSTGYDGATYPVGSSANYARKHNPCTNWVGTGTNQFANTVNQPLTAFPDSANYSSLPTVSFVVPNLTDDMHDYTCSSLPCPESIAIGDTWMHTHLDSLRWWSLHNNTLYILIYDEDDGAHDNNIPVIFYGPMVKGGSYSQTVTHFNLLRTIEDIYSLSYAGAAADSSAIKFCWRASATGTGVNNVNAASYGFTAAPNPASNMITFNCNRALTVTATINVFDETGHAIGSYPITGNSLQVTTAAFDAGLYVYQVTGASGAVLGEGKFIIMRK